MPSLKVDRVLAALGDRIRVARKKRRIPVKDFAERIGVGEGTAIRLEKGDPGIRMGTFAMALLALGELDRLDRLLDPADDDAGLLLERDRLPKRIDRPRRRRPASAPPGSPQGDDEGEVF